ncbi:MAG: prepilin-type N-terminal cleavage/methylation domain-containing protein [Planctomycetota bacterium]
MKRFTADILAQRSRGSLRVRAGFTLTEVLIALGILAVGITSVASLFPPAILMQKETVRDILGQQNVRSSEAILRAKTIDAGMLFNFTDNFAAETGDATDRFIGAYAVRTQTGLPLLTNPYYVPNAELDVFALAEIDEYIPEQPPGVSDPTDPLYVDNTEFPDMRLAEFYLGQPETPVPPASPNVANYAAQQSALSSFGIADRSFPSYVARPRDRELFTVPLVRRGVQATPFINDWTTYGMILANNFEVDDELRTAGDFPYPRNPAAFFGFTAGIPGANATQAIESIVCANPFDDDNFNIDSNYVPKVFRVPAFTRAFDTGIPENTIRLGVRNNTGTRWGLLIQPGDLLLGDDGKIYRVAGYTNGDLNDLRVVEEGRQVADEIGNAFAGGDRSLRAVWFALRPRGDAPSPLRDIRILSADTVRLNF